MCAFVCQVKENRSTEREDAPPSAGAEDDVDARVSKNGPAHVSHFKSKGGVFKWLLHLT